MQRLAKTKKRAKESSAEHFVPNVQETRLKSTLVLCNGICFFIDKEDAFPATGR